MPLSSVPFKRTWALSIMRFNANRAFEVACFKVSPNYRYVHPNCLKLASRSRCIVQLSIELKQATYPRKQAVTEICPKRS